MGLEFASSVITYFKADTKDMKAGLKELTGLEKEHAKAQLDAADARNKGYDEWIGKLANVNQALELGGKVLGVAIDSWKAYADHQRLAAAAGGVSMDKLKAASLGLRTEHELLTFAAQTQNAAFKLNEDQMVTAQKAMVALTRAGFDQEEVTKKVTDALVKANGGGLDDFGILVKSGSTDLEKFNNLMDALAKKAANVDSGTANASEGIAHLGVSMHDSMDKMKVALGSLVDAMSPLLEALAGAVSLIADITAGATGGVNWIDAANKYGANIKRDDESAANILGLANKQIGVGGGRKPLAARDSWNDGGAAGIDEGTFYTFTNGILTKIPVRNGKGGSDGKFSDVAQMGGMDTAGRPIGFGSTMYGLGSAADSTQYDEYGRPIQISTQGLLDDKTKALTDDWKKRLAEQQGKKNSFLESSFGPLEDFNAYSEAFGILTGSVTAAMDAWIDGSMGAGEAIKKFLAGAMKGLATSMAVEALKHGAYAVASLAFGDVAGASAHGTAAGLFAAGSAAAAVAAKELGGGGGSAAKGGSAGSVSSSTGGAAPNGRDHRTGADGPLSSGGKETVIIAYADPFAFGSPNQRRANAARVINSVTGGGAYTND